MELELSPSTEAKLRERAKALGMNVQDLFAQTIQQNVEAEPVSEVMLPRDKWKAEFDALLASLPVRETNMDDSRESIYRGRGE